MINKESSTIGGIPRNCFKRLAKVGLSKTANRINLIRECTQFSSVHIEIFVSDTNNEVSKYFLLFVDESSNYLAFTSFGALIEYLTINYNI